MIYDKAFLLGLKGNEEEVLEYLKQVQPSLKKIILYSQTGGVGEEINRLSPPPAVEEPPEPPSEPEQTEPEEEKKTDTSKQFNTRTNFWL